MSQEPKKRHSRQRQGKRRAHIHLKLQAGVVCSNCKKEIYSHTICKNCGYYNGKQVLVFKEKQKPEQQPAA